MSALDNVNSALKNQLRTWVPQLIPGGKVKKGEYVVTNPTRSDARPGSFSVNLSTCMWSDFATGEKGGDPQSLYCYIKQLPNSEGAINFLKEYGDGLIKRIAKQAAKFKQVAPIPDGVELHSTEDQNWVYTDADGRVMFMIVRYLDDTGKKQMCPYTYWSDGTRGEWRPQGLAGQKPLLGLQHLTDKTVLVVEGEKTYDSARERFPEYDVVTWAGGAAGLARSNWTPLKGRRVIIWPDNDEAGFKAAENIREILGDNARIVDFNPQYYPQKFDLADITGDGKAEADALHQAEAEARPTTEAPSITPLGHHSGNYFFTSSSNRQISMISSFSKPAMLDLAPLEFYQARWPKGADAVNWDEVTSDMMADCRDRGLFQPRNIRGAGVWNDENRIVINMGDHLVVDGERVELGKIKSRYFYTLGVSLRPLHPKPLSVEECTPILNAAHGFRWKKNEYGYLLAGAMVTLRVCGGLPIRPHVWLTGERGSGKTTLFNRFINPLVNEPRLFISGNSTEAGIRQSVNADAVPIIIDEFETHGDKSAERIKSVLDLFRSAWSETDAVVLKGSAGGIAQQYQVRFGGIVTCIRPYKLSDADQSRFASIELDTHSDDSTHWQQLDAALSLIDTEMGDRLFARIVTLFPVLIDNFKVMKQALSRAYPGQRFGDQYGMLLAGYVLLLCDQVATDEQADAIVGLAGLEDAKEDAKRIDQEDALHYLVTTKVAYSDGKTRQDASIGEMVMDVYNGGKSIGDHCAMRSALLRLGIRVDADMIQIAAGEHAEMKKLFANSRWSNWGATLSRLDGAKKDRLKFNGHNQTCVSVPFKHFNLG